MVMKMNDSIKKLESISDIIGISERMILRDSGIEKNAIEILKSAEKARKVHRSMMLKVINNQEKRYNNFLQYLSRLGVTFRAADI